MRKTLNSYFFVGALIVILFALGGCAPSATTGRFAPDTAKRGRLFATPEEALAALNQAFNSGDPERLVEIYGEAGRDIIVTGDATADKVMMNRLSNRFAQRLELLPVESEDFSREQWYKVRFGNEGWLLRIPLINRSEGWYFETRHAEDAARKTRREINEVEVVDTMWAVIQAQREYIKKDRDGDGVLEYAARFISNPGKHDGLYWPAEGGEKSPLEGPIAAALESGYQLESGKNRSYEGYHYRILTSQGKHARGGARSFLTGDSLTKGFAVIAYPVTWNVSGLRSFAGSMEGKVFKKDMGFKTVDLGSAMKEFNPDSTWAQVEHPENYSTRVVH